MARIPQLRGVSLRQGRRHGEARTGKNRPCWIARGPRGDGPAGNRPDTNVSPSRSIPEPAGQSVRRTGNDADRDGDGQPSQRRFPGYPRLHQPSRRGQPDGRAAVGGRHQPGPDAVAGCHAAGGRGPQRAGRHHRLGRGRKHRHQYQHQRLLGPYRPLPRRHARSRPVLPRRLCAGAGRGPDGPVLDAVRPRLDRRRHQPGDQEAVPEAGDRTQRPGHDQRPRAHDGRCEHALPGEQRSARVGDVPGRQGLDRRPDERAGFRPGADGQARHRHADRDHARRNPAAPQGPGELRRAEPERLPAQGAAQYRLWLQRRLHRAGRHRPAEPDRAQVLAQHEPSQPDGVRLGEYVRP